MLAAASIRPVDVVKVSHHGSRDQSIRLYEKLQATVGLIGVGADNDYGHPTDDTLAVLASTATAVGRTDRNGLVLVSMRGGVTYLWTEKPDDAAAQ
jgi:competence protein ComEC